MSTARDTFLERVRHAVAEGNRAGGAPSLQPRGSAGYQGAGPDAVERFRAEVIAAGGQAHLVPDAAAAARRVLELVQGTGGRRILVGRGSVLDSLALPGPLRQAGFEVMVVEDAAGVPGKDALFAADVGISGVHALVAETGTVVVATAPEEPRSLSLLPPVHVAVATRAQLVPDLFDLFAALEPGEGRALPSCLTLITGPSKTGDIELRLVTGVHGPGAVHVVLITA
jgi:L-lactate dehydrogenase complex protein LldG